MSKFHKEFPDIGMSFEQVKKRIKKYESINKFGRKEIADSLKNQLRLAEGEAAVHELDKELSSSTTIRGSTLTGAGAKQTGWGPGKKLGDGRWKYKDTKWERYE